MYNINEWRTPVYTAVSVARAGNLSTPLVFWISATYTYSMKRHIYITLKNSLRWLAITLFVVLLGVSCATGATTITDDLTPMELIQRGQEASSRNRFAVALQYYRTLLERFPHDLYFVCAAEYEIAFIYYRREARRSPWRRDFTAAQIKFHNLLERYNTPDAELLPPQFRVLSEIVLARIEASGHPPLTPPPPAVQAIAAPTPVPLPVTQPTPPTAMLPPGALLQDDTDAGIEAAAENAVRNISVNLTAGSRIAVFYVMAQDIGTARRVEHFLQEQGFSVVSRAELDRIRVEQGLLMGGAIDDITAARIGYLAGASVFLTVGVVGTGAARQLNLIAMDTTTIDVLGIAIEAY